jgi:iron complex transport system ATP-binding protein
VLDLKRVSVLLGGATVVSAVSLRVEPGGWLGLVGPNGAGKTTLLRAVAGLVHYEGFITIDGQRRPRSDRRGWARCVAYVPQRPVLPLSMTVTDYVLLGRSAHHSYLGAETARDRQVAAAVLDRLDLARFASRRLGELSGGEAQRAVLARALVQEAPVLLMDEPTASLDLGHAQQVLGIADRLRRDNGLSVLCSIHDLTLAAQYSDRLVVLAGGEAVLSGPPNQVLTEANVRRLFEANVQVLEGATGPVVVPARPPERATHPASTARCS